jgi:hypothetical protein
MKYFIVLLTAMLLTGCDVFRKAPEKEIEVITTFDAGTSSTGKAVNDFTASLSAFAKGRLEGAKVQLKIEEGRELKRYAEKILLNTRGSVNFTQTNTAPDYIVTARFSEITPDVYNWQMSMARAASPQAPVWRYSAKVDTYKLDKLD